MSQVDWITLTRGALRFPALAAGDGPLVLLLHGFPDGPETFAAQLPALAAAGYRAVAPTLRGYAVDAQPTDSDYHVGALAEDVLAWADDLGASRTHLVGHDWGATIAFAAASLAPERITSLATLAVPHPARMAEASGPDQQARYQYIIDFQAPDAAERVAADEYAYLVRLWQLWSPGWQIPAPALIQMRARFAVPGVLDAALAYYRQALDFASPDGQRAQQLLSGPFLPPTLGLCGADDGCILAETFTRAMRQEDFPGGLHVRPISGAGHFFHREQPEAVNAALLDWLARAGR